MDHLATEHVAERTAAQLAADAQPRARLEVPDLAAVEIQEAQRQSGIDVSRVRVVDVHDQLATRPVPDRVGRGRSPRSAPCRRRAHRPARRCASRPRSAAAGAERSRARHADRCGPGATRSHRSTKARPHRRRPGSTAPVSPLGPRGPMPLATRRSRADRHRRDDRTTTARGRSRLRPRRRLRLRSSRRAATTRRRPWCARETAPAPAPS